MQEAIFNGEWTEPPNVTINEMGPTVYKAAMEQIAADLAVVDVRKDEAQIRKEIAQIQAQGSKANPNALEVAAGIADAMRVRDASIENAGPNVARVALAHQKYLLSVEELLRGVDIGELEGATARFSAVLQKISAMSPGTDGLDFPQPPVPGVQMEDMFE